MNESWHPAVLAAFQDNAWGEMDYYTREWWRQEIADTNTQLGYWDWVDHQLKSEQTDLAAGVEPQRDPKEDPIPGVDNVSARD